MKYWHEEKQNIVDSVLKSGITESEFLTRYNQPDWCSYPEALVPVMGCWSLMSNRPDGMRAKISIEYCKRCECFKIPNKCHDLVT